MPDAEALDKWTLYEGHVKAYQSAVSALGLELPDGITLPELPAPEPEPGTVYQVGAGAVEALFAWLHAVEKAAIEAHHRGDAQLAQKWVETAAKFIETDTFAKFNDPNVPVSWFEAVIVPARAGDFTPMAADLGIDDTRR